MSGKNTIEPTIKERLDKLVSDWNEVCAKLSASNREPCDALVFRQNSNHIWKSLVLLEKGNDCKGPLSEAIQKFESIILKKQKEVYSTILGIDEELMDKLKKEQTELSNEIYSTSVESTHKFTIGSAVKMIDEGIGIIIEARDDDYGFKILYDGLFISWFLTSKLKLIKSDTKPTTKKVFDLLSGYFEFVKSSSRLSEVKMASVTELISATNEYDYHIDYDSKFTGLLESMKSFVEPESLLQFKEETTIFPAGTKVRISSQVRIHDGEDGEVIKESDSRRLVRFYDGDEFWYPLNELRNYYPEDITCNLKSIPEAILMFPTDTEVEVPGGRRGRVISKMDNERLVKFKNPDYSSSAHWYRVDELSIPATIPKKLITSELKVGDRVKHNHSGDIGTVVNIHAKDDIIEYRIQYDNLTGLRWNSGGYITKLEKVKEDIDMKKSDQIEKVDTAPLITDFSFEVKGVKTDIIYSVSTEKIEFMDPILDVTKIDDFIAELNIVKDLYDRMTKG